MTIKLGRVLLLAGLIWSACATAPAAPPDKLTLADMANRPDRWPEYVTYQGDFKFGSSFTVHKGDKAKLLRFDGTQVQVLGPGNAVFNLKPENCALLDAANEAWSALTPAQRAIEPATLAADPSLWPVKVATTSPINASYGKLPVDSEVVLVSVTDKEANIAWPNSPNGLRLNFELTDIIARARQLALMDRAKRPSRMAAAFQGMLVNADGSAYHDDHANDKKIYALYYGANWCAPCHQFSPDLVKFLDEALPKHPELAAVFVDDDDKTDEMLAYMKEAKMPFPAMAKKDVTRANLISDFQVKIIPHLVIVDRFGKILASNDDDKSERKDPADTIGDLKKLLEKPLPE